MESLEEKAAEGKRQSTIFAQVQADIASRVRADKDRKEKAILAMHQRVQARAIVLMSQMR